MMLQHLREHHKGSQKALFLVQDKYTFEVSGKSKGPHQVQNVSLSYVASDD